MAKAGRKPGSLARHTCKLCGMVEAVPSAGSKFRCSACKAAGRDFPLPAGSCELDPMGGLAAQAAVFRMRRDGIVPPPSACTCTDCGARAHDYDHRDYNKPKVVEPVCRGCNLRRGPAIPLRGSIERIVARGGVPYTLKVRVQQLFGRMGLPGALLDDLPARLTNAHWQLLAPHFTKEPAHG